MPIMISFSKKMFLLCLRIWTSNQMLMANPDEVSSKKQQKRDRTQTKQYLVVIIIAISIAMFISV